MSLSLYEKQLAYELFNKFAVHTFAVGVYESMAPMAFSTSTASSITGSYLYSVKTKAVQCEARVPGLDQEKFVSALSEFVRRSQQHTIDILSN